MPQRYIREAVLTSARVNELSAEGGWGTEAFYKRLLNKVDDYGRYDARAGILRAALYPLCTERVTLEEIDQWLAICHGAKLVTLYTVDSRPFLAVTQFSDKPARSPTSKWPPPPLGTPEVMMEPGTPAAPAPAAEPAPPAPPAPEPEPPPLPPAPKPRPEPKPAPEPKPPAPKPGVTQAELESDGLSEGVALDWLTHRKARRAPLTHAAWDGIKDEAQKAGWALERACKLAMVRGWTGFSAEWLTREGQQPHSNGNGASYETPYQRSARERMEEFAPGVAAKKPGVVTVTDPKEIEDVTFRPSH